MNLIKRQKMKQKNLIKRKKLKQKYSTKFTFYKYRNIKSFFDHSFASNRKNSNQFNTNLELLYKETRKIKPTNEDQKKIKNIEKLC